MIWSYFLVPVTIRADTRFEGTVLPRSNLTHAVRSRFVRFAAAVRAVCGYGSCGSRLRFGRLAVAVRAVRGWGSCGSLADCAKIITAYSDLLRAIHFIMQRSFGVEWCWIIKHTIYEIIKQIAKILNNTIHCKLWCLVRRNFVFEKLNYVGLLERYFVNLPLFCPQTQEYARS